MDRTTRQKECLKKWISAGGAACIEACTGFGKTRIGLNLIDAFIKRNEESSILVVVPSDNLKNQWIDKLEERGVLGSARVEIINTVVKSEWTCNLLIIDKELLM